MRHAIIGTAGHVDHGKTALVHALTGVDTDRLKEEKERGLSIEIGFAPLRLPSGRLVGVIDVPGHERFIKNMVAGASGIDLVLLVVAADEGVMPQTREHLDIISLLGIRAGIVVLTKTDLVDRDWLELIEVDLNETLRATPLAQSPRVRVSATTGTGLGTLLRAIDTAVGEMADHRASGPFRMSIDRAFSLRGFGTVVTGTLDRGIVRRGDTVELLPSRRSSRVRHIQVHGEEAEEALPGQRTALNLPDVGAGQIERGEVAATPGSLRPTHLIDVRLRLLEPRGYTARPLVNWQRLRVHIGTAEIMARVVLLDVAEVAPGGEALAQLQLEAPTACATADRFILRSYSPQTTIGGGSVLDPAPERHRGHWRAEAARKLHELEQGGPRAALAAAIAARGGEPFTVEAIATAARLTGEQAEDAVRAALDTGELVGLAGGLLVDARALGHAAEQVVAVVRRFHADHPLRRGIERGELRNALQSMPAGLYRAALAAALTAGELAEDGETTLRVAGHEVRVPAGQEPILNRAVAALAAAGLTGCSTEELQREAGCSVATAAELTRYLRQTGRARAVADRLLAAEAYENARRVLLDLLGAREAITVAEFRDATGASRKPVVALLEHFDTIGLTIRQGDLRRLAPAGRDRREGAGL